MIEIQIVRSSSQRLFKRKHNNINILLLLLYVEVNVNENELFVIADIGIRDFDGNGDYLLNDKGILYLVLPWQHLFILLYIGFQINLTHYNII